MYRVGGGRLRVGTWMLGSDRQLYVQALGSVKLKSPPEMSKSSMSTRATLKIPGKPK